MHRAEIEQRVRQRGERRARDTCVLSGVWATRDLTNLEYEKMRCDLCVVRTNHICICLVMHLHGCGWVSRHRQAAVHSCKAYSPSFFYAYRTRVFTAQVPRHGGSGIWACAEHTDFPLRFTVPTAYCNLERDGYFPASSAWHASPWRSRRPSINGIASSGSKPSSGCSSMCRCNSVGCAQPPPTSAGAT
jgi:hypothetical protein